MRGQYGDSEMPHSSEDKKCRSVGVSNAFKHKHHRAQCSAKCNSSYWVQSGPAPLIF